MWLSEKLLYFLAKRLYRGELALSTEMKEALTTRDQYNDYRRRQLEPMMARARQYGVDVTDKVVLDFGCNEGAIALGYLDHGARAVVGVDIDADAVQKAQQHNDPPRATFLLSTHTTIPLPDESVDVVMSCDVFEHVTHPAEILAECRRVLRPGGQMLLGTWGWYHPYAPHLSATMPVPWAHVFFSERTILRTCRRVYHSPWYVPRMFDLDAKGQKLADKYQEEAIPASYLNKLLLRDFDRLFRRSGLDFTVYPQAFGSRYARWTRVFLKTPWVREFITSYIWVVLRKRQPGPAGNGTAAVLPARR